MSGANERTAAAAETVKRLHPRRCIPVPDVRFWKVEISRDPEFGDIVSGVFTPVLRKILEVVLADRLHLDGCRLNAVKASGSMQGSKFADVTAKVVYEAFIEGRLEAPMHLARNVHDLLRAAIRRIPTSNNLGPPDCVTALPPHSRHAIPSHNSRLQPRWREELHGSGSAFTREARP
jgi:hypothetical protein